MLDTIRAWTESLGHEISVKTCTEGGINYASDAPIVAMSVYTQTAPAAYRIAARFMEREKIVILGGPHFHSALTLREAETRCDVVAPTISRQQWEELLARIESGSFSRNKNRALIVEDLGHNFCYPDELAQIYEKKPLWQFTLVPASLGCPYRCEFCSPYLPGKYVTRDIDRIYNEIRSVKSPVAGICDATFGLDRGHAMALMKRIAPLKKQIWIETTLNRLRDGEFLDALALGGVTWIAAGIESLSVSMTKHGPGGVESIGKILREVSARGMLVQGNFICGMDGDGPDSFTRIHEFCAASPVHFPYLGMMVPFPTTKLYERFIEEKRITHTSWERYDYRHVVFHPKKMPARELASSFRSLQLRLTAPLFLARKSFQILATAGLKIGPILMIAYSLFTAWDTRKTKKIAASQKTIFVKEQSPAIE
jgi:radical SAM superfamily enzyme YgiQ (UPF0313 family)